MTDGFLSAAAIQRHDLSGSVTANARQGRQQRARTLVAAALADGRVHPKNAAAWREAITSDPAAESQLAALRSTATEAPDWQV